MKDGKEIKSSKVRYCIVVGNNNSSAIDLTSVHFVVPAVESFQRRILQGSDHSGATGICGQTLVGP